MKVESAKVRMFSGYAHTILHDIARLAVATSPRDRLIALASVSCALTKAIEAELVNHPKHRSLVEAMEDELVDPKPW